MVLHHSCSAPGPWSWSAGGDDFLRSGNNTRELCCIFRGAITFIHSQTAACIVHFIAVATTATLFTPIHSLSALTHAPSLSLIHSYYTTLTTMATAYSGDPYTELEPARLSLKSQVWTYFGSPVSYVDNVRIVGKKASLQALQKLNSRLFCLGFHLTEDIRYCYIMLLLNLF